jgi:steroid 5-alpha reductase family enzyme
VLLTLIFEGSTRFTERLSVAKYPSYADYQARTSRWLPWPSAHQVVTSKASP